MKKTILAIIVAVTTLSVNAQNPVIHTCFSTDPAPMVYGDRVYVFTGHDEEGADFFWMNEWRLFSSADMVNWTDHGCPLAQGDLSWADDRAWAPQCIERNGKFYLYVPVHSRISRGMAIGVAVADKIEGPYKDPLGKPLFENGSWDHIDPTVMIDADGQAYLYWGNPRQVRHNCSSLYRRSLDYETASSYQGRAESDEGTEDKEVVLGKVFHGICCRRCARVHRI